MLYAIVARDRQGSQQQRIDLRDAHRARLSAMQDQGRLVVAGPFPAVDSADPGAAGFCGSLVIAEFESLAAARDWADADPYATGGVYETVDVRPWCRVFPK